MNRSRSWVQLGAALGVVVALAIAPVGGAQRAPEASSKAQAPDTELIVKFKPGVVAAERERALAAAGGVIERKLRNHPARLAKIDAARLSYALKKLRSDPRIEYAERNQRVHALIVPADPSFDQLWGLRNTGQSVNGISGTADADIDADEAWDVTTGSSSVVVGVIDTGVDFSHPDLGGSATASPLMWKNPGETGSGKESNGVDDDANGYVDDWRGWDFANNDNNPFDDESHGTHVTGTIGARANDGVGVSGVNWNVNIMALKFLDGNGFGDTADAVEAIAYATAKGAHVTNSSWGSGGYSQALLEAIQGADAAGSLFVAAAGNDALDNDAVPSYPASYDVPNVVSVAASTQTDGRASFSNIGRQSVHLAAPGTNIYSTVPGGGHDWWNGTSMATPHVAGAAALVKAAFPSSSAVGAKALLLGSVDAASSFANLTATGGRLNVARAVSCNSTPMLWVEAPKAAFRVSLGDSLAIVATSTMCAGAGATATAEVNGTPVVLTNRGDGLFTGSYVPNSLGPLTVTVTATAGALTTTRTITGTAVDDYHFLDDTYAWIDAATGGTRLTLGDDASSTVTLPFSFSYYRQAFTSVKVSSNGYIVFGDSPATDPLNAPIPTSDDPNGVVAPFWDDLHPGRNNAAVWHRTVGTAPNRKFVVSWINVPHFFVTGSRITFQAILEEATGDIVFQYADTSFGDEFLDHGGEATVGVENLGGTLGREFSFNKGRLQPYQAAKALRVTMRDTASPDTTVADFDGDGDTDIAVWRPGNGLWALRGMDWVHFGLGGDIPVPADYDGDGDADIAVWRPGNGLWALRGTDWVHFGQSGDIPVPADYDGDGDADIAVWRPGNGLWALRGADWVHFGQSGDIPLPADYDGDGDADIAVWRPGNGLWALRGTDWVHFGLAGDIPLPADYDGDGDADIAVWRPGNGLWALRGTDWVHFGQSGDIPLPLPAPLHSHLGL